MVLTISGTWKISILVSFSLYYYSFVCSDVSSVSLSSVWNRSILCINLVFYAECRFMSTEYVLLSLFYFKYSNYS